MDLEPLIEACRPKGKTAKDWRPTLSAIVWRHQNGAKWRAVCQQTLWTENIRFRVAFDINRETTDASYSHICCQSETMSSVPEGGHALRFARVFSHLAPCGRSVARF